MQDQILTSPREAGVIAGLSVRGVNKIVDEQLPPGTVKKRAGHRFITFEGLLCLRLERDIAQLMTVSARRKLFALIVQNAEANVVEVNPTVRISVSEARKQVRRRLADLRKAKALIASDPDVLRGASCFKGTRIPVHLVDELLRQGASPEELQEDYPSLTAAMLKAAPIFAAAYPRRGRPPKQPWQKRRPKRVTRTRRTQ